MNGAAGTIGGTKLDAIFGRRWKSCYCGRWWNTIVRSLVMFILSVRQQF